MSCIDNKQSNIPKESVFQDFSIGWLTKRPREDRATILSLHLNLFLPDSIINLGQL